MYCDVTYDKMNDATIGAIPDNAVYTVKYYLSTDGTAPFWRRATSRCPSAVQVNGAYEQLFPGNQHNVARSFVDHFQLRRDIQFYLQSAD